MLKIIEKIEDLLVNKIIEKENANYSSPIVMIPKKDKTYRMCVNYIKLNQITVKLNYQFMNINILREKLNECKIFSKLDMADGYHQINIHPDDREFTAFNCHLGTFVFNKLPFGLSNAPIIFQMDNILQDCTDFCHVNLDDTIIFSKDVEVIKFI